MGKPTRLLARLREAVSATAEPQLQRGQDNDTGLEESALSSKQRDQLDKSDFAIPETRSYPIPDESHARNALARVAQHGTPEEKKRVRAAVKRKFPKIDVDSESVSLRILLREASPAKNGDAYECTIVREGPGNPGEACYYTREALREAVNQGLFEGLQAYLNHPTVSEERERPERDVRYLAGHFREARFVDGNPAEVRAKFIPGGMEKDGVVSLIESALESHPDRPLVGISIDGYGHVPDQKEIGGHTYNMVREVTHLGSADIVTRAGAGGRFHRRLQEAWRNLTPAAQAGTTSKEERMKPAKLQEKIKAAVAKLVEAAGLDEKDSERADELVKNGLAALRECADATVEPDTVEKIREVEKPVAATGGDADKLAVKVAELETRLRESEQTVVKQRQRRKDAESKLDAVRRGQLAHKIIREAQVPEKTGRDWFDEVVEQDDEPAMRALVERKKAARDEMLAELRETFGVEGAGPRQPITAPGASGDLLDRLGLDRDEYAPAAA